MLICKIMPGVNRGSRKAFTLVEVVMSLAISVVVIGSVWTAYITNGKFVAKTIASGAANAALIDRTEQIRGAKWDLRGATQVDELISANFPVTIQVLNLPVNVMTQFVAGAAVRITNTVYATNTTTISQLSASPPLRMIRTDCTWKDRNGVLHTNTVITYRSPTI
jgi:hypothetical protein